MLISSPSYMQTRTLEMALATLMVCCGSLLLCPGDTFAAPIYALLKRWMSEEAGGGFLLLVGLLRWVALVINGRLRATPLARVAGCMIGAGFWLTFAVAMAAADRAPALGLPLFLAVSACFFTFEFYSGIRCGTDASALDSLGLRQQRSKVGRGVGV